MNLKKLCSRFPLPAFLATVLPVLGDVPGYSEPYKTITVSAAEPGVIAAVAVEEGARVKAGQVLARLDTAQLEAELEIAKATTELQKIKVQRLTELARNQRAAAEELDRARTDLKIREAEMRKIQAAIESRILRSPVDGLVTEVKRDPSEAVNLASPHVLTVVQIDRLLVNLFLSPSRASHLKVGAEATLLLGEEAARVVAKVDFISPVVDAASGTVRVKFILENVDGHHRSGVVVRLAE